MVRTEITHNGNDGVITYDEGVVTITGLPDDVETQVREYLSADQDFNFEMTDLIDTYQIRTAKPTDDKNFFKLGTLSLYANTGVWVNSIK